MYHTRHADATRTGWTTGRDDGFGLFVPGIKTTVENGATRMIPGSHLWGDDRGASPNDAIYAEMEVGEALTTQRMRIECCTQCSCAREP